MNGYSEDLRDKVVAIVGRGISKSQAARTFGVSLSSVKRYVNKAHHGESLAPKKSPGSALKLDEIATKLLEADLKQSPFATLQERRDYIHALTGISVSRSSICRAIARIGSSRKKGDDPQWSATSSEELPGG
jgi:transposase